jgi:hypothetical protein
MLQVWRAARVFTHDGGMAMITLFELLFVCCGNGAMLRCAVLRKDRWAAFCWLLSVTWSSWLVTGATDVPVYQAALAYLIMSLFGWLIVHAFLRTFPKA